MDFNVSWLTFFSSRNLEIVLIAILDGKSIDSQFKCYKRREEIQEKTRGTMTNLHLCSERTRTRYSVLHGSKEAVATLERGGNWEYKVH